MGADFYRNMLKEIGEQRMFDLEMDRRVLIKNYDHYLKLIDEYTKILNSLKTGEN
jgi:hypothetical protein